MESRKGEENMYKVKTVTKSIGEVISTRRKDGCNKDSRSDIDKGKRRGEEDNEEVKILGEEYCDEEKNKKIATRSGKATLKRKVTKIIQPKQGD